MRKMEKFLALALVGILGMSLTACGGSASEEASAPAEEETSAVEETEEAPAAEETEDASAAEETAGSSAEEYNVIWVTCSTASEFWQYQEIGMRNAVIDLEEEYGITINFETAGPAEEAQTEEYLAAFETAISKKPDAIISATQVPDSTREISKQAMDQGIIVNFTNCGLETLDSTEYADCYNQFYTTVSADIGDMAGEIMLTLLGDAGISTDEGVISMEFSMVNPSLQPRMDNFQAYVQANSGITVLDTTYNNNDLSKAQSNAEAHISTEGDKLIGLYAANNVSANGLALAVQNAGISDKVVVIGVDSDATEIQALRDGYIDCIIVQDAYGQGYAALENAILTLMNGSNPESEQKIAMPPVAVYQSNIDDPDVAGMLDPNLLKKY